MRQADHWSQVLQSTTPLRPISLKTRPSFLAHCLRCATSSTSCAPHPLLPRRAHHQTERSCQKQAVSTVQNGISRSSASGKSIVFESFGAGNSVLPSSTKNSAPSKCVGSKTESGTRCQVFTKTKPISPNLRSKSRWFRGSILSQPAVYHEQLSTGG
jgi:hypothetical protein